MIPVIISPSKVEVGWLRPFKSKDGTITHFKMIVQTLQSKKPLLYIFEIETTTLVYQDGTQEELLSNEPIEVYTARSQ